jgi:endonuclease/exonuclease/phosphatase family metal-dependent hydrolase
VRGWTRGDQFYYPFVLINRIVKLEPSDTRANYRVMSYNVRVVISGEERDAWEKRRESVASTIRVHRPDIVGLQEPIQRQLEDLEDRLLGYRWIGVGRRDGESEGEYCPIGYRTSRFDVETRTTFWLSESPDEPGSVGWDASYPRIATSVRLRDTKTDTSIFVTNTHFDHEGGTARVESARLLKERVDATAKPAVVVGDFNCEPGSLPYRTLVDSSAVTRLVDAKDGAEYPPHGPAATFTGFGDSTVGRKIDHVFVSPDVQVRQHAVCADTRPDGRFPSDHFPLVADIAIGDEGGRSG